MPKTDTDTKLSTLSGSIYVLRAFLGGTLAAIKDVDQIQFKHPQDGIAVRVALEEVSELAKRADNELWKLDADVKSLRKQAADAAAIARAVVQNEGTAGKA